MSVGLVVVALGVIAWSVKANFGQSDAAAMSSQRTYVDSVTGKPFGHDIIMGEKMPVESPSGNPGFPAEMCYWNADGTIRKEPFPVLVNAYLNKPGPTFCPDCGRLVVPHNPMATKGDKPPPTKTEYDSKPNAQVER